MGDFQLGREIDLNEYYHVGVLDWLLEKPFNHTVKCDSTLYSIVPIIFLVFLLCLHFIS